MKDVHFPSETYSSGIVLMLAMQSKQLQVPLHTSLLLMPLMLYHLEISTLDKIQDKLLLVVGGNMLQEQKIQDVGYELVALMTH